MLSSTEAEYGSLASGATQVKFVEQLLEEIAECKTPGIILEDNTGAIFLVKLQQVGSRTKHIDVQYHYIREMREQGEVDVLFVHSEQNSSIILTKNVLEKVLSTHADMIRNGMVQCREDWFELVEAIEEPDKTIHHVQWEDVKLWIQEQHTDDDRQSELACTVRDEYLACQDSFDVAQSETVYVC
jgi:hypothetical protein